MMLSSKRNVVTQVSTEYSKEYQSDVVVSNQRHATTTLEASGIRLRCLSKSNNIFDFDNSTTSSILQNAYNKAIGITYPYYFQKFL